MLKTTILVNLRGHKTNTEGKAPRYEPGTVVYSRVDHTTRLVVTTYSQGIYYCAVIGDAKKNNLPFLECQLEEGKN
jgi:hypothetical protein